MTSPLNPKDEATRKLIKEALTEWLDERIAKFGWWSLGTLLAMALAGIVYLALVGVGWHK